VEGAEQFAPIVLCDGIGCDGYVWRHLRRDLAGRRLVHPHYRGHGRSSPPGDPSRVSIPDLADDLAAVLDDSRVERAVVAGHSMGVQVALETYRRHRDRVVGLVLLCGAPSHPLRTFRGTATLEKLLPQVQRWILRAPRAVNRLKRVLMPTRLAFEVAGRLEINRTLIDPGDFMPYLEGLARIDVRLFVAMLAEAGRHSADDVLPTIDVPALVVAGDRDGFTPPDRSRAMAAAIPGSELLIVEDGSHTAPIERPALVGEIVQRFLTTRADPLFRQRNSAFGSA
jgi:pimeloyl-ACP methyl ester carboxylesterase